MSVTPDFVGQIYKDTNTGNLWRANSLTPGDWTLEVQNMQWKWTPHNFKFGELAGIMTDYDTATSLPGITSLVATQTTFRDIIKLYRCNQLVSLNLDFLTNWNSDAELDVSVAPALTTFSAANLTHHTGFGFTIQNCPVLTSVSMPSFIDSKAGATFGFKNCATLATLSFPSAFPLNNSQWFFNDNALNASSINGILARFVANPACVTGFIQMDGGTNSPPTGQGIADKATLQGRGLTVVTN